MRICGSLPRAHACQCRSKRRDPIDEGTDAMMYGMARMMWSMGLVWLIVIVMLALAVAVLVKCLFLQ